LCRTSRRSHHIPQTKSRVSHIRSWVRWRRFSNLTCLLKGKRFYLKSRLFLFKAVSYHCSSDSSLCQCCRCCCSACSLADLQVGLSIVTSWGGGCILVALCCCFHFCASLLALSPHFPHNLQPYLRLQA